MSTYRTDDDSFRLDKLPPICPRCTKNIAAVTEARASQIGEYSAEFLFRCPACKKFFIGSYSTHQYTDLFCFSFSLPTSYPERIFPRLGLISSSFQVLYNQSAQADAIGLNEIAGSGYRKALEFLVKDYCVAASPTKADAIRSMFLGNVIRDFIDSGKLKRAATLTSWLGNDEGHYERKWADKDLTDLKSLLELTIAFVDEEIQLELYTHSMQPDEPPHLQLNNAATSSQ